MTDPRQAPPSGVPPEGSGRRDPVLEAKYLDFCSAKVAEVLLALSADEMYVLAQDALAESGRPTVDLRYEEIVGLATERISGKLALPSFDDWVEAYGKHPERFEREMIGLWESELDPDAPEGESQPGGSDPA